MKKVQFKLDTKKGQIVYFIELNIHSGENRHDSGFLYKEGLFVTEKKISLQTKYKIALNDEWITLLDRLKETDKKESYKHCLEDINIVIKTKETYWPNGIFASCYTLENPEKCIKTIKHKIINKIEKEYGFLYNVDFKSKIYEMEIIKK